MKRISLLLALILMMCFASCTPKPRTICGLGNFSRNTSSLGVTDLFPEEYNIEAYPYLEGNYYFYTSDSSVNCCEKSLMYLRYNDENYALAKQYAFENLSLSKEIEKEHNGYQFHHNFSSGDTDPNSYHFIYFACNDANNTLLFIGFYVTVELYDEVDAYANDWGAFLENYYGEFYDFSK